LLAQLGAEVIRIEPPGATDPLLQIEERMGGDGSFVQSLNAGKRRMTLAISNPEGQRLFRRLLATTDVLVESYRPQTAARLGLASEQLAEDHPRLIHCSLTACGIEGMLAERGGHDLNLLAMSGVLAQLRPPDGAPIVPGIQVAGIGASALPAVQGILAALLARTRDQRGRHLVISIIHNLQSWLGLERSLAAGRRTERGLAPCYRVYTTADGRHVAVGAAQASLWEAFCRFFGKHTWVDRQFDERLSDEVQALIAERSFDAWRQLAAAHRLCVEPVLSADEAGALIRRFGPGAAGDELLPGVWFASRGTDHGKPTAYLEPWRDAAPAPRIGEHTAEILEELGVDTATAGQLRAEGVV
jgi:crotonobetainyl-CoA:carnitine CoA-transferase CaiB-like acyl-CoA transferase